MKKPPIGCSTLHHTRIEGNKIVCMYCRTITGNTKAPDKEKNGLHPVEEPNETPENKGN